MRASEVRSITQSKFDKVGAGGMMESSIRDKEGKVVRKG